MPRCQDARQKHDRIKRESKKKKEKKDIHRQREHSVLYEFPTSRAVKMDWVKSLGRGISAGDKKKLEALEKRMAVLETVPGRVTVLEDDSKELEVNRLLQ